MTVTVMERATPARYKIHSPTNEKAPLAVDITATADGSSPFMEPPTVPYIFRLFYIDPDTGMKKEYRGETELPGLLVTDNENLMELDEQLKWEMEMCSPFLSASRPNEFEGPGVVLMKKYHKPEVRITLH